MANAVRNGGKMLALLAAGMFFPPYGRHRPNCTRENPPPQDYLKAVVKVKKS